MLQTFTWYGQNMSLFVARWYSLWWDICVIIELNTFSSGFAQVILWNHPQGNINDDNQH